MEERSGRRSSPNGERVADEVINNCVTWLYEHEFILLRTSADDVRYDLQCALVQISCVHIVYVVAGKAVTRFQNNSRLDRITALLDLQLQYNLYRDQTT